MDISSLFVNSFRPPKFVELSSDVIVPLSFPGGCTVPAVEGRHLSTESSWKELRADLFLSSEEAIHSLTSISMSITELISVSLLVSHSNGKCRRVSIREEMGHEQGVSPRLHTFVPVHVVMGSLLMNLHKFEVSKKLRFATLATQSLERALEVYPKISRERIMNRDCYQLGESGLIADEYDESLHVKYKQSYRTMRYLVPPNIARTDLKKMLSDGVPKSVADRVWSKKVLWLLCMHATDIPKVHIADLRGKYECHGLDIVELRALWYILPRWEGGSPKAEWRRALKARLDDLISKEISGKISTLEMRDSAYMGHENLMIYDPDRTLHRQFGVSVSTVGLPLGQRRMTVFTRVDLRETPSLVDDVGLLSASLMPDRSPDTDGEREGELKLEDVTNSHGHLSFSSCSDSDIVSEEDDDGVEDEKSISASPIAGDIFRNKDRRLCQSSVEVKDVDDDDTDKDTELDDLLNYEISLNCLDIDFDAVDSLSVCSEEIDIYGGCGEENHWRDRMSVGGISSEASDISVLSKDRMCRLKDEMGDVIGLETIRESVKIPRPRKKSRLAKKNTKALLKGTPTEMLIENYRPFSFAVPLKKPLKRLNFIAAHSGQDSLNTNPRSTGPSLDYFCDDDREQSPPRLIRSYLTDVAMGDPSMEISTGIRGTEKSSAARGRAYLAATGSHSSALELMYSHQSGDREYFEFNPLVFPPGSDLDINIRNAGCSPKNFESAALNNVSCPDNVAIFVRGPAASSKSGYCSIQVGGDTAAQRLHSEDTCCPALDYRSRLTPFPHTLPEADKVSAQHKESSSAGGTYYSKLRPADDSSLDCSFRSVDSVGARSRSTSGSNSESSSESIFSSFSAFSMHSVKSAAKYLFSSNMKRDDERTADSICRTSKYSRSKLFVAQLEQERAKERQRDLERELEGCGRAGEPSDSSLQVLGPHVSSGEGDWVLSEHPPLGAQTGQRQHVSQIQVAEADDMIPRRVWNTFPTISVNSARKGRFISAEEELVDNEIESEIDNFIVPDELSPIILRQYGIEIGMREVNGIRQNALMSLPALLSEIGMSSDACGAEDEEDYINELTESELGLWGSGASRAESSKNISVSVPVSNEPLEDIERLISSLDSANPLLLSPMGSGCINRNSRGAVSSVACSIALKEDGEAIIIENSVVSSVASASTSLTSITIVPCDENGSGLQIGQLIAHHLSLDGSPKCDRADHGLELTSSIPSASKGSLAEPVSPLTAQEAEELILYKEAHLAWSALSVGSLLVSKELATLLLLKFAEDPESVVEPLETLVLLVDKLGADVNATNGDNMTPLHSLFSKPALGRFILSRGGDVLAKDDHGDSVLAMCAEYGYHWVLPAFMNMHGREANLLEDPERAHEYAVILISLWGFGTRVRELIEEGLVSISADEALDIMDTCKDNFEDMKEPVETFELLESLVLKG